VRSYPRTPGAAARHRDTLPELVGAVVLLGAVDRGDGHADALGDSPVGVRPRRPTLDGRSFRDGTTFRLDDLPRRLVQPTSAAARRGPRCPVRYDLSVSPLQETATMRSYGIVGTIVTIVVIFLVLRFLGVV
jgi:hypothetical protein